MKTNEKAALTDAEGVTHANRGEVGRANTEIALFQLMNKHTLVGGFDRHAFITDLLREYEVKVK